MAGVQQVSFTSPYAEEDAALARRQRMAELLQAQGQQPLGQTEMVGGWAIPKSPLEGAAKKATVDARRMAKQMFPEWKVAREGDPDMPSVKSSSQRDEDKPWKNDLWLPRCMRLFDEEGEWSDPSWDTATKS